jgi:hypothetical protein
MNKSLGALERLLVRERGYAHEVNESPPAKRLQGARNGLLEHIRTVSQSGDLALIVTTERTIVERDLQYHANSQAMTSSLKTALNEMAAIERHIGIVDSRTKYRAVDQAYSLPKNRKGGLPFDEARQALASHYTRLNNMDKSRLGDDEKKVIDARKSAIFNAGKLYAERQAKSLGIEAAQGKKRGNHL